MSRSLLYILLLGLLSACNTINPTVTVEEDGIKDILWIGNDQILTGPLDMQTLLLIEVAGGREPLQMERAVSPRFTLSSDFSGDNHNLSQAITDNDLVILQAFGIQRDFSNMEYEENATSWIESLRSQDKEIVIFYPWFTRVDDRITKNRFDEMIHKVVWQQDLVMVPVGPAWETAMQSRPNVELYAKDGIHPSAAGVYLTACVFYASLTGESPLENPVYTSIGFDSPDEIVKLESDTIEFLQTIAWDTIEEYRQKGEFRVIIKQ